MTDKHICPVPKRLFEDWESRGLIFNMEQDGDIETWTAMRGKGKRIRCSEPVLRGLQADALWLLDPCMGQDSLMRTAARKFIATVDLVLSETGIPTAQQKGTR